MNLFEKYKDRFPVQLQYICNANKNNRVGHAFLVVADSEELRHDFSIMLAQTKACSQLENGKPCSNCKNCQAILSGTYIDMHTLSPVGKLYMIQVGDRINPAPNTVRYFEERFHLTSQGKKVGIINDADRMNSEAQNALLKTLEEPPPDTIIILNTANAESLLPTTRSRCQQLFLLENKIKFEFAGADELFRSLYDLCTNSTKDLKVAENSATTIIKIAANLNSDATKKQKEKFLPQINAASQIDTSLEKKVEKQFESAAAGAYMKERKMFLSAIHTFCAQIFLLSNGVELKMLPNSDILEEFKENLQTDKISAERGNIILKEAEDLLFNLRFNTNEELSLRTFAVNLTMKF